MIFNYHILFRSILVIFTGVLFSCGSNLEEANQIVNDNNQLGEVSENVTLYFSDNGKSKIKLEAPILKKITILEEGKKSTKTSSLTCPNGMLVTFFDSLGNVESKLYANFGRLMSENQFLLVKDSVVFTNPKNEKLETELLNIYFNKDSITTPEKVKITTKEGVITGEGLTSNTAFSKYTLHKISDSHYNFKDPEKEE
jgi:LPS export ABC transporter protein LptC